MSNTAEIVNINKGQKPMPSKNGFVMAWRDMRKQPWYKSTDHVAIFTHIMLSATSKPMTYNRKGALCQLHAGEFVTTYDELGAQFGLDKSKVRRIVDTFIKHGQITKRIISENKINKGIVLSLTGWNKWQNSTNLSDTWTDTQTDTSKAPNLKVLNGYADTQPDTQPDTVLNNKVLNNKRDMHDSSESSPHLEIRKKAFEHFWKTWGYCKKIVGRSNTAPKSKTQAKFLALMNDKHVNKIGIDGFRTEINLMCELALGAHQDIAENKDSSFFNYESMYPAKYISNKQWRDCSEYKELSA